MAEFISDFNNCPMCMVKGPALIPARYAVVTDNFTDGIPSWAVNPKTAKNYQPVPGYNYALRAMRQGFIYVFYEKSRQWDAWAVCEDGSLWKQPSGAYAQPKKTPDCTSPKHQATNLEMMILDEMTLKGNTWLAFSPSKWMHETLERYASDAELRKKRMQYLESWQWTTPANSLGVTAASPGSLESILDYKDSGMTHPSRQLPYNPTIRRISQTEPKAPWYNFEESAVKPQGTIYPWSQSRIGGAPRTMQALKNRHEGKNKYDKDITPLVMAIEDPVGIAHELAGFGDDFAALHAAWVDDFSIEFFTDQSLVSVQTQLEKQGEAMKKWVIEQGRKNAPLVEAMTTNWSGMSSAAFNEQYQQNTAKNAEHTGDEIAHQWSKYDAKLNHEKRMAFRQCYTRFCSVLSSLMEALHQLRINWLTSPLFITCSQDFYSVRTEDNLSYLGVVDYALASLNLTDTGVNWLDTLINQYSAEESNLIWRSILLNNPVIISEMNVALRNLAKHHGAAEKPDEATLLAALAPLAGKFTEAYGQANEVLEKNPTASSPFSQIMLHFDRRMSTLGDRFFNFTRLGQSIDGLNTLMSKAIFQVASGYSYADTVRMSVAQVQDGVSFRQHILSSLNKGSEARLTTVNRYQSEFDEFVHSAEGKKALKGMRIKLLALFFNGLESANLLSECKGNVKDVTQVAAAFLATMSTASEIVEPLVEKVFKSERAIKDIKLFGPGAGSVASVITFALDVINFGSEAFKENRRWSMVCLSIAKSIQDVGIMIKSINGLLEILVKQRLLSLESVEGISVAFGSLSATATIRFLASWELMLTLFFVEESLSILRDNELQLWCEKSVFGLNVEGALKNTELLGTQEIRNKSLSAQSEIFQKAVEAIL